MEMCCLPVSEQSPSQTISPLVGLCDCVCDQECTEMHVYANTLTHISVNILS